MPTVILLSSSPPRVFARSPTPAGYSSASQSSNSSLNSNSLGRKRFKTSAEPRDGFSPCSRAAREVLASKHRDINKSIQPLGRNRSKTSPGQSFEQGTETVVIEAATSCEGRVQPPQGQLLPGKQKYGTPKADRSSRRDENYSPKEPSILQRAVARRIDWTPPKSRIDAGTNCVSSEKAATFPEGFLGNFGHQGSEVQRTEKIVFDAPVVKRRKLSHPVTREEKAPTKADVPNLKLDDSKTCKKRNKSPSKKTLTITALATSNYLEQENFSNSSMMQYLTTTQGGPTGDTKLESKVRQQEEAVKKLKASKKIASKSRLVSPSSALRSVEQQETIFGSASQLVKDKITTGRKSFGDSNIFTFSDPLSSPPPPHTQPVSIESTTPQMGTARFRRSRNLWTAAGRDEDNALLHIDTVDLSDSPAVRNAFAGKDVMVQPASHTRSPNPIIPLVLSGLQCRGAVMDIDDLIVPAHSLPLQRALSTSARAANPGKRSAMTHDRAHINAEPAISVTYLTESDETSSKKPDFAGLSDAALKKRISAFGFKAIKSREKMIELLDRCWEEKNHSGTISAQQEKSNTFYGEILSNVHDVSARPVPKKAKPKACKTRKKQDEGEVSAPVKKPRQRCKKEDGNLARKITKPTRQRKTTASEKPPDVYDIVCLDDSAKLGEETHMGGSNKVKRSRATKPAAAEVDRACQPISLPQDLEIQSEADQPKANISVLENARTVDSDIAVSTEATPLHMQVTPTSDSLPEIQDQITRAIYHESFTSNVHLKSPSKPTTGSSSSSSLSTTSRRNHQVNPTWHEKILLYDPIILEDLAAWLNTVGLGQIGEDREVSALEVRSWCETKGICCLWKGGWRGQKGGELEM